jgi:hypothetical protein
MTKEGCDMTDMQTGETAAVRTFPDRRYDLFLREGAWRLYWKLNNEGVSLSADTLRWDCDGRPRERSFNDLREVRLQIAHVHKSGDVGICQLIFNDGLLLTVQSTDARGFADEERTLVYGDFVRDLHARLAARQTSTIAFNAGDVSGRRIIGVTVVIIAVVFFVGLPLGLFLFFPGWDTLGVLGSGAAFVWPIWRTMNRNEPRVYAPGQVPADLIP